MPIMHNSTFWEEGILLITLFANSTSWDQNSDMHAHLLFLIIDKQNYCVFTGVMQNTGIFDALASHDVNKE